MTVVIRPRPVVRIIRQSKGIRINAGGPGLRGLPGANGGPLPFKPSVGRWVTNSLNSTTLTNATASVADVAHLVPFIWGFSGYTDQIQVNVVTAVALAEGKLGLFRSDSLGRPYELEEECAAPVSFATTGVKAASLSSALLIGAGELVWLSIRHSHAGVVLSAPQLYSTPTIDHATGASSYTKLVRKTGVTYANPMPSAWTWSDADLVSTAAPIVGLRIAA